MKTLFLIDGAAGTGKSDLVEFIRHQFSAGGKVAVVTKFTTRPHRPEEQARGTPLDLEFVTAEEFAALKSEPGFLWYEYGDHEYGFRAADVEGALNRFEHVFLIVRNHALILRLIGDYRHVRVVPVLVYSDHVEIRSRMAAENYNESDIQFRLARANVVWSDYIRHPHIYHEKIINAGSKADFCLLIEQMIGQYSAEDPEVLSISAQESFPLIRPLFGYRAAMMEKLSRYPYHQNVFLMMKFRSANRDVFDYIATNLSERGLRCVRADQPEWRITRDVYNPIAVLYCCRYGIALFDEPEEHAAYSPNVAYELGMMHLQGKDCLILRHTHLPSVPFDLVSKVHKVYARDLELKRLINEWIEDISAL
jgi:guanylate kinase